MLQETSVRAIPTTVRSNGNCSTPWIDRTVMFTNACISRHHLYLRIDAPHVDTEHGVPSKLTWGLNKKRFFNIFVFVVHMGGIL